MARTPIGPRAPKEEFMRALGLKPGDAHCEGLYRSMRDEAIAVYNSINSDRSNLKDEQQQDESIQPPFFWHHIREERRETAVRQTWQNAQPGTVQRLYFDQGQTNGDHRPNWVTLWLLYSVFRSRDIRNNRNRRTNDCGVSSGGNDRPPDNASRNPPHNSSEGASNRSSDKMMYDPARNSYVPAPISGPADTRTNTT